MRPKVEPMLTPFARRLRKLRERAGLSQLALAQAAGLVHGTVQQLESGASVSPSLETARKLAAALGVTIDELAS